MTFFQLNIALISLTLILVSLMATCFAYRLHTVKTKMKQIENHKKNVIRTIKQQSQKNELEA